MKVKTDVEPKAHIARYLFGSAVYSDSPSDIDVAIVYDKRYISIDDAISYRLKLSEQMAQMNSMMVDTILLSVEEEKEMAFLENAKYLEF